MDIRRTYQDYNFVLEDDSWAHLEFESDALTIFQLLRDYSSPQDSWKLEKMQAALFALANKFLNRADLDKVKEVIRMTVLGQMLKDEGIQEGLEEGIRALVETFQELDIPNDVAREKLMQKFQLSLEAAEDALAKY